MTSLLITNGLLATLDHDNRFVENGSVYVEGNRIVAAGNLNTSSYSPDRTIDAGGKLVMPGIDIPVDVQVPEDTSFISRNFSRICRMRSFCTFIPVTPTMW